MSDWIQISLNLFNQSSDRIIWNLFLAFIPLGLSYFLFRISSQRNFIWWILLLVFLAFLPNAPYILTDSIHIIELSQQNYPLWAIALVLIPQYILFITAGFVAYVIALLAIDRYCIGLIDSTKLIWVNGLIHFFCVVGIYIGRFERFNSWDLIDKPGKVLLVTARDLADPAKLSSMVVSFFLIWLLAELIKLVSNSIILSNSGNTTK